MVTPPAVSAKIPSVLASSPDRVEDLVVGDRAEGTTRGPYGLERVPAVGRVTDRE